MNPTPPRHAGPSALRFSLIELLAVVLLIGILLGILLPIMRRGKEHGDRVACANNINNLALAIQLYLNEYQTYPHGELCAALADFSGGGNTDDIPPTYVCPTTGEVYDAYYVAREIQDGTGYVLSCPCHRVVSFNPGNGTRTFHFDAVVQDGAEVAMGADVDNGRLQFDDGATAVIHGRARLVASFRREDGRLYSIIRIFEGSDVNVKVPTGSEFEVVTPAAIVAVRGTEFKVQATYDPAGDLHSTRVDVSKGTVSVIGRKGGGQWEHTAVSAGQSVTRSAKSELCQRDVHRRKKNP